MGDLSGFWTGGLGGVGAGLKQNVLEQQPVDYSGQTIAVIFPTRVEGGYYLWGNWRSGWLVSYQGNQLGHVPHSPLKAKNHHEGRCFL